MSRYLFLKEPYVGSVCDALGFNSFVCETVAGGMNLARREFYEQVGLQDNLLFMYSDEVDMGLRAKKLGVNLAVTTEAKAWHQHLNAGGGKHRMFYTSYLMGRNKVYLAKKHFGFWRSAEQLAFHSFLFFKGVVGNVFHKEKLMHQLYFIRGSWNGFTGDMELGKIIKDFKPDEDNKGL